MKHNWKAKARCAGVDTDIFYPVVRDEDGNPVPNPDPKGSEFMDDYSEDATEESRSLCVQCPVIFDCLTANLNESHGVFADTSPEERRALRRKFKK